MKKKKQTKKQENKKNLNHRHVVLESFEFSSLERYHNSFIVGNNIADHTLILVSMIPHLSKSGCSNLYSIGGVEMVTNTVLPVAMERDCSRNTRREAIASNSLTDVSMLSS